MPPRPVHARSLFSWPKNASCSQIPLQASSASLPPRRWSTTRCRLSLRPWTAPLSCRLQPLLKLSLLSLRPSLLQFVSIVLLLLDHGNPIFEPVCGFTFSLSAFAFLTEMNFSLQVPVCNLVVITTTIPQLLWPNDDDCFYHHSWRNNVVMRLELSCLVLHTFNEWRCLRCLSFCRWWQTEKHSCRSGVIIMRSYPPQYPRSSTPQFIFLAVSEILNHSDTCAVPSVCDAVGLLILLKLCPMHLSSAEDEKRIVSYFHSLIGQSAGLSVPRSQAAKIQNSNLHLST